MMIDSVEIIIKKKQQLNGTDSENRANENETKQNVLMHAKRVDFES